MSKMFEKILLWYQLGMWDIEKVRDAVTARKPKITPEEFEIITGQKFE